GAPARATREAGPAEHRLRNDAPRRRRLLSAGATRSAQSRLHRAAHDGDGDWPLWNRRMDITDSDCGRPTVGLSRLDRRIRSRLRLRVGRAAAQAPDSLTAYLRGNLHAHTTFSDGVRSPERLVAEYEALDYDFLAITD